MSATSTPRKRRSAGSKAEQDKAQREAKAAEAAAASNGSGDDEASEAELAAQVGRPSNETPAEDAPAEQAADDDDEPAPTGAFGALPPAGSGKTTRVSKWTDRLNAVAEHQAEANEAEAERAKAAKEKPVDQWAYVHQTGTPATATSVASDVRKKLAEGRIGGLVGGGKFELKTRGRQIHARFVPDKG